MKVEILQSQKTTARIENAPITNSHGAIYTGTCPVATIAWLRPAVNKWSKRCDPHQSDNIERQTINKATTYYLLYGQDDGWTNNGLSYKIPHVHVKPAGVRDARVTV